MNVVSPGSITTPILGRAGLSQAEVDGFARAIVAKVPMKRFGKPEEVADTVLFWQPRSRRTSLGWNVNVDGGLGQV